MKQETTIFNADYCFFPWKGRRVFEKQISCGSERKGSSVCCRARVGEWVNEMILNACGFN